MQPRKDGWDRGGHSIRPGTDDRIVRWNNCPDCDGRGWYVVNPFAQVNKDFRQCPRCLAEYNAAMAAQPQT